MRNLLMTLIVILGVIALATPAAFAGNGNDGSFAYHWARDDDGDGIPNGLDPDWTPPKDGTGYFGPFMPFVGPMLLGAGNGYCNGDGTGNGDTLMSRVRECIRNQNQNQKGETLGDIFRNRLRSRDGSCAD